MRRREFITLLGGAAAALPLAARAEQSNLPVVGFLHSGSPQGRALRRRWPRRRRQTHVFAVADDPVKLGLVTSLNRPGGNATGINNFLAALGPKRLGLLHEALAQAPLLAVLRDPKNPVADSAGAELRAAAASIGQTIEIFDAKNSEEITAAFTELVRHKAGGLVVIPSTLFTTRMIQIVTLATRHAIPAVFQSREWAEAGGLMSYGANGSETWRQVGVYAGRILRGAKPAELPVEQSSKFEFVINLQTAKIFGLQIPPTLSADEVIE